MKLPLPLDRDAGEMMRERGCEVNCETARRKSGRLRLPGGFHVPTRRCRAGTFEVTICDLKYTGPRRMRDRTLGRSAPSNGRY
jgi:hypothetical protein